MKRGYENLCPREVAAMTTRAPEPTLPGPARPPRPSPERPPAWRRVAADWPPLRCVLLLATVVCLFATRDGSPGVSNTASVCVMVGLAGLACSGRR
jgi:hypothetical protein